MSEVNRARLEALLRQHAELGVKKDALEAQRKAVQQEVLPLLREVGSVLLHTDKGPRIAGVRAPETLVVDAGELLEALIEQEGGDEEAATAIWTDVLKPPEVDTKDGGLFHKASEQIGEQPARIRPETVAKVATYKSISPHIGWSKPSTD